MPPKLFNKKDIPDNCPYCRKELEGSIKCLYCNKLLDEDVANLKERSQDRIYGGIFCYAFSPDKSKIAFVTGNAGSKNPAFYLYDIKSLKIIWANMEHFAARRMFYLEDRIIIISRSGGLSSLASFDITNGKLISRIDKEETWTNMLQFKNDFLIGFRDGLLYRYNKNLEVVNTICLKEDPESKEESYYCNPAPFNIVTTIMEDYVAFSSEKRLFLLDSELNLLWEKFLGPDYFVFRRSATISQSLMYWQQKRIWAFEVLGIASGSNDEQIKNAFRNKVLEWHPDRQPEKIKKRRERNLER